MEGEVGGGVRDEGRSPLSAQLAAYGERLRRERRLREAEEKVVDEVFEVGVGGINPPVFKRDFVGGRGD